ncbi:MAG: M20 family peptidase [Bacteroidota bacterium]
MKKVLKWLFIGLGVFILVLIYNTLTFTSQQITRAPIPKKEIPDEALERMAQSIQIPTISHSQRIDSSVFYTFLDFLDSSFVYCDSLMNKWEINKLSRVYHWPGKNANLSPILLIAHHDVVPIEAASADQWQEEPFSGVIKDGWIWGRGALDDKGSVVSLMEAAEMLLREGYEPERTVYFAFGHDEEVGGADGALSIAHDFKEKGITFEYVLDEGSMVVEKALPGLEQPAGLIGLAEKGSTTLLLTASGTAGHSSMPPSQSTIGALSKALSTLEANPMPARLEGPIREMFEYTGPEMNLPFKVLFANLWATSGLLKKQLGSNGPSNAVLRTTTAITMINGGVKDNVLPARANATINFRIKPGDTVEDVIKYVEKTIDNPEITVSLKDSSSKNPSKVSPTKGFGFQVIQTTLKEIFPDVVVAPSLVIAATDSRHYKIVSNNIYRFTPVQLTFDEIAGIHGINERISVENYRQSVRFFYQLMKNSCQ